MAVMVRVLAVMMCAVNFGLRSAVLAVFLSFLGYNFFFHRRGSPWAAVFEA